MHTVFALLCFVVVIHWLIFPYSSGLLCWHWGNRYKAKHNKTLCMFLGIYCIGHHQDIDIARLHYNQITSAQFHREQFGTAWVILYTIYILNVGPISDRLLSVSPTYSHTVYPKKYAHGFCFAVFCCGYTLTDFPTSIRLTSLALWQSNDCPSASKATLMNMDKYFMWIHYERLHNHNKAKHNKTVCIFLGIYCNFGPISHRAVWDRMGHPIYYIHLKCWSNQRQIAFDVTHLFSYIGHRSSHNVACGTALHTYSTTTQWGDTNGGWYISGLRWSFLYIPQIMDLSSKDWFQDHTFSLTFTGKR